MPGRMEFEFDLGGNRKGRGREDRGRDDSKPMRLLVIGDFSGRPVAERPPLSSRPTHRVDIDTLDVAMLTAACASRRWPSHESIWGR